MKRVMNWIPFCLALSAILASTSVLAIYDPDNEKQVFWEGCNDPNAGCDPEPYSEDQRRNDIYLNVLKRSVVKINTDGGKCTGLYVGDRFVITAAHCFFGNPNIGNVSVEFKASTASEHYLVEAAGYFAHPLAVLGTKSTDDVQKVKDVIFSWYTCDQGKYDVAVIVLKPVYSLKTASSPTNQPNFADEVTPYYDPDLSWASQNLWGFSDDLEGLQSITFGYGFSDWRSDLHPTGNEDDFLRTLFKHVNHAHGTTFSIPSLNASYLTDIEAGDSGGPAFVWNPYTGDYNYVGIVSGAGVEYEWYQWADFTACLIATAPLGLGTCLALDPTGGACGWIPPGVDILGPVLFCFMAAGDSESCFTSLRDNDVRWYIVDILESLDGDQDGFLAEDSYATVIADAGIGEELGKSAQWINEEPWPTKPDAGAYPINCTKLADAGPISSMWDNCPEIENPDQEDYDCDGVGDVCDNCPEHFNPFQENWDGDKYGDVCDNCPMVQNDPERDINGDGVINWDDQWDLDGDGNYQRCKLGADNRTAIQCEGDPTYMSGGDICDLDLDGDNELLSFPDPEIYKDNHRTGPEVPAELEPVGDCAPYLWTASQDVDGDRWCDNYNFVGWPDSDLPPCCNPKPSSSCQIPEIWLPQYDLNVEYNSGVAIIEPGDSYLKKATTEAHPDIHNEHYMSRDYMDALETPRGEIEYFDDPVSSPGEFGYSWTLYENDCDTLKTVEYGYEGCLKNLIDVWRYYGGQAEFDDTGSIPVARFIEKPAAPANYPRALKEIFIENLNPQVCSMDNCIRFNIVDFDYDGSEEPDPLSQHIMDNDDYSTSEHGTHDSTYCWTANSQSNPTSTHIECEMTNLKDPPMTDPSWAPGYAKWYINEDQLDTNEDGIGDKCSAWIDIENFHQFHDWRTTYNGQWTRTEWEDYSALDSQNRNPNFYYYMDKVYDKATGLEIRKAKYPYTEHYYHMGHLSVLCDQCALSCTVEKKIVRPAQRLEFDVTGFSANSTPTTIGACSCFELDHESCYNSSQYCWHPPDEDRDNPNTIAAYNQTAKDSEYRGSTGRPRFPGFRLKANHPDSYWENKTITPACGRAPKLYYQDGIVIGLLGSGWNESVIPDKDGCQELHMTYRQSDHKTLSWRYMGQVEPPQTNPDFDPETLEQKWSLGHTTMMRLGTSKGLDVVDPSIAYWYRQWHTPYDDPFMWWWGGYENHKRPIPEADFGREDVVIYDTSCAAYFDPRWIDRIQIHVDEHKRPTTNFAQVRFMERVNPLSDRITAVANVLSTGTGTMKQVPVQRNILSSSAKFPTMGYGWMTIYLKPEDAEALFGYQGDSSDSLAVDVVIGGYLQDGTVSQRVWIAKSWEDGQNFKLVSSSIPVEMAIPELVYDSAHKQIYVVHGQTSSGVLDRVYGLDLETMEWSSQWDCAPGGLLLEDGLKYASVAVDAINAEAYLISDNGTEMTIHEFTASEDGPQLALIDVEGEGPSRRMGSSVIYHPDIMKLVLYGGTDSHTEQYLDDMWTFDARNNEWIQVDDGGGVTPGGRSIPFLIPGAGAKMFLFGGMTGSDEYGGKTVWQRGFLPGEDEWSVVELEEEKVIIVDDPWLDEELLPGNPVVYRLVVPEMDDYSGHPVQIQLGNSDNVLQTIAYSSTSRPSFSTPDSKGKLSLLVHKGEEWRIVVTARDNAALSGTASPYSIRAVSAEIGQLLKSLNISSYARFDVVGDVVYVANWWNVQIFRRTGSIVEKIASVPMTSAVDIVVEGDIAYVADFYGGLAVLDVSDPENPVEIGSEWMLGTVDSIAILGNRVFLSMGLFGVAVVDVSDPSQPQWVDIIMVPDIVVDVSAGGSYLLVGGMLGKVHIYSADNSGAVTKSGTYRFSGWMEDSALYDGLMYLKKFNWNVDVVNISVPGNARSVSVLPGAGNYEIAMKLGYDTAVIPGVWYGLKVLDVVADD